MDPNQQPAPSVAPAPASPQGVQGTMPVSDVTGLSQDQMKQNLQELMDKIQSKYSEFDAHRFSVDAKTKEQQSQTLRDIFDMFEKAGIDPSDPEAVKAFLEKMKEQNPELYAQVEKVLQSVLGGDQGAVSQMGVPEQDPNMAGDPTAPDQAATPPANMNTNPNEALPENL